MNVFQREPDVRVLFEFNGERKNPVISGYRPNHLIKVLNPILCMSQLDGAEIIAISELGDYGYIKIEGTNEAIEIAYLAICKYESSDTVFLFLCDKNFSVENDWDFESIEKALENANARSKEPIKWNCNDFIK